LRVRRSLVALLALALGLTGLLLIALSGTAGSVPKENTTVITPTTAPTTEANTTEPDRLLYN